MRIIVHGHFYQPPRDNPWTGSIDYQPSAAPFHDWNERIHAECYRPNAFADLETSEGERIVNNFERISFNVGPTLIAWLEKMHPATYDAILAADRASIERLGHGNAIAQSFHHTILPLSPIPHVRTEVRWGLADFRHRFGRDAEGMWLPETALNDDVLQVLIEEGVAFTIAAPHQVAAVREPDGEWQDVSGGIDTRRGYRYQHPDGSGRWMAVYFYDGDIAQKIAFGNAMSSASGFLDLFAAADHGVVHAATDGETYGHHQKFGDVGLAYALWVEAGVRDIEPINYGAWLASEPPEVEIRLPDGPGTSWSCAHGVGRWMEDCGCSTRAADGWNQRWRAPLRRGLELVRDAADEAFARLGAGLFLDPAAARDRYVEVVISATDVETFIASIAAGPIGEQERSRAEALLEMQRNALAMFTSCGWFFADIADIETVQIMRYSARTIEILETLGQPSPREAFLAELEKAESNDTTRGSGADVFTALFE